MIHYIMKYEKLQVIFAKFISLKDKKIGLLFYTQQNSNPNLYGGQRGIRTQNQKSKYAKIRLHF